MGYHLKIRLDKSCSLLLITTKIIYLLLNTSKPTQQKDRCEVAVVSTHLLFAFILTFKYE